MKNLIDYIFKPIEKIQEGKKANTKKIIEEIHHTFYTEVDRLLADSNVRLPEDTPLKKLLEKREKLVRLGFEHTQEVYDGDKEIEKIEAIKKQNVEKEELAKAIKYFSDKYPHYKFITEESVKKICRKYNLVYGTVDKYIGTVPDKNIQEMERFKIDPDDIAGIEIDNRTKFNSEFVTFDLEHISYGESVDLEEFCRPSRPEIIHFTDQNGEIDYASYSSALCEYDEEEMIYRRRASRYTKCPLEIVAPKSDFNMSDSELKDFKIGKIEIPDPVVLQPVVYTHERGTLDYWSKTRRYYLIVTAWGDEASDELIMNPKMN